MKVILSFTTVMALTGLLLFACSSSTQTTAVAMTDTTKGFALLELYTSQGCSSCPAADKVLASFAAMHNPQIIPLAFHVDYWNRLGWTDPFSRKAYSERQRDYADMFNSESIYTPQLIVNGTDEMVGSDRLKVEAAINRALARAPVASVTIDVPVIKEDKIAVSCTISGDTKGRTLWVALVLHDATTDIRAGENTGVKLMNVNIVRDLQAARLDGQRATTTLSLPGGLAASACGIIAFLQQGQTGRIEAAQAVLL